MSIPLPRIFGSVYLWHSQKISKYVRFGSRQGTPTSACKQPGSCASASGILQTVSIGATDFLPIRIGNYRRAHSFQKRCVDIAGQLLSVSNLTNFGGALYQPQFGQGTPTIQPNGDTAGNGYKKSIHRGIFPFRLCHGFILQVPPIGLTQELRP
jgi:hypothetical protein